MDVLLLIIYLFFLVLSIVMIVKFFQLCADTRDIKSLLMERNYKGGVNNPNTIDKDTKDTSDALPSEFSDVKTAKALPTTASQKMRIGSYGICTFIDEKPKGTFNFKTEKGQYISLLSKDVLELGDLIVS